jgi:hypothetical protein
MNQKPRQGKPLFCDGQVAKAVYLRHMSAMKELLNLGEIKFGDRNSSAYKLYKKVTMDEFYNAMSEVFEAMERAGMLRKCPCGTSIRQGYKTCDKCNGAGHCNADELDDFYATTLDSQPGFKPMGAGEVLTDEGDDENYNR